MPSWVIGILKTLGAPFFAGVVAAYLSSFLTAKFSFERFRREQWWQLKREAYDSTIRALTDVILHAESYISHYGDADSSGLKTLEKTQVRRAWTLEEIAAAGTYMITFTSVDAVQNVLAALRDADSEHSMLMIMENYHDAADQALAIVRKEMIRDLKVSYPIAGTKQFVSFLCSRFRRLVAYFANLRR